MITGLILLGAASAIAGIAGVLIPKSKPSDKNNSSDYGTSWGLSGQDGDPGFWNSH